MNTVLQLKPALQLYNKMQKSLFSTISQIATDTSYSDHIPTGEPFVTIVDEAGNEFQTEVEVGGRMYRYIHHATHEMN